ncbi:MAG: assimilatory sulfite reductase (NADPH) flavoprotein subunit [Pseudomonadota bacterium]
MMLGQLPQGINPLSADQAQQFETLMGSLSPLQQAWISGYLASSALGSASSAPAVAPAVAGAPLTVLYGSQTGNAKHLAQELGDQGRARGLDVQVIDMASYKPSKLKDEKYLTIVTSTYGEGEPPEPAQKLFDFLASKKAPNLDGAQIAVLGIGDSSYEQFCQTAVDFENRLVALGASVVVERALLDVDYDDYAQGWIGGALDVFEPEMSRGSAPSNVVQMPGVAVPQAAKFNKKSPFAAELLAVQKITGRDSTRDVRHIELSLDGSGLTYQPGDALGVYFQNDADEVDAVLALMGIDGDAEVTLGDQTKPLRAALIEDLELTQSYPTFVEKYVAATGDEALRKLTEDKAALRAYIEPRQIFDILRAHPHAIAPQALVDSLRKMQPRLYSIASSQSEVEDEVHLTVGVVEWQAEGHAHLGGASGHLGRLAGEGDSVRVYVEHNDLFRLPDSPDTPVIMIGPGTGIAPFRAFLQEREAQEADGKSWLFFGNPHFTQDFLYQVELQNWLKSGVLSRLDVAFSRDQAEKIYVQDRLREAGAELYAWLEAGAHLYVCGDANRMAKDVHAALVDIVAEHGQKDREAAIAYVDALRDARRYQRDVY